MRILQQKLWKTLLKSRLEPVIKPHQLGRSSNLHHPGAYKKQNTKAAKQSERSMKPAPVHYTSQVEPTLSHKKQRNEDHHSRPVACISHHAPRI